MKKKSGLERKLNKATGMMDKIPPAVPFQMENGILCWTYALPTGEDKIPNDVKDVILRKRMVFACDKRSLDGKQIEVRFHCFVPTEDDDLSIGTMAAFGVPKDEWGDYMIYARFFAKFPDGDVAPLRNAPDTRDYQDVDKTLTFLRGLKK